MTYTILRTEQKEDTLFTDIEYTFDSGEVIIVSVAHFQPQSKEEVIIGIENRGISEEQKLNASKKISEIVKEL